MTAVIVVVGVILACFGFVVFRGAPYVPTLRRDVENAIDLARLKPGDTIVDLGSGDGRLLMAAADRRARAVGYELNPLLVLISRWRCRRYGRSVRIHTRDFWQTALPNDTNVVFTFLAKPYMSKLSDHLAAEALRLGRPILLVSYGFEIAGKEPIRRKNALLCYQFKP